MPFRSRSRGMGLRPVNRIKHVVDLQDAFSVGVQGQRNLILADDAPVITDPERVQTGSTVNAIYLHVEVNALSGNALPNFYLFVAKNPGGNLTFPNANAVGSNDNKRYVIHQEMVMLQGQDANDPDANPRTAFNGVIVLPKGYRRFGPNDALSIHFFSPGVQFQICLQCHYKEFR